MQKRMFSAERLTSFEGATRARGASEPEPMTPAALRSRLGGIESMSITVTIPGIDYEFQIIDATTRQTPSGAGNGSWLQLIPAGHVL